MPLLKDKIECATSPDGNSKCWYLNGDPHREDGPAYENTNGDKEWWINGELHREDGPAIERPNGHKEWFEHGLQVNPNIIRKDSICNKTNCKEYSIITKHICSNCKYELEMLIDE